MTKRRRPSPGERIDDELCELRRDVDALNEEMRFMRNFLALAPYARSRRPRRTILLPTPRRPTL